MSEGKDRQPRLHSSVPTPQPRRTPKYMYGGTCSSVDDYLIISIQLLAGDCIQRIR